MKFAIFLALAASVLAGPLEPREVTSTQNEFVKGGCRDMILFWARGSDQEGNMVCRLLPRILLYPNRT